MLKFFKQGLSLRLFILIYSVMATSFALYTLNILHRHRQDLLQAMDMHSRRTADLVRRSTHYGMLLNQNKEVQQIIANLGNEPGVLSIRVYNKEGAITFSTDTTEIHKRVQVNNGICATCHTAEHPSQALLLDYKSRIIENEKGLRILDVMSPIRNETSCYSSSCHAHTADQTVLGVMDIRMSLAAIDNQIKASRRGTISTAIYIILAMAFLSGFLIYFGCREKIRKLIKGTQEVAAGNLDVRIEIKSKDEIGILADSFNGMTRDLKAAHQQITEWSDSLEDKVREKTDELHKAQEHIVRMEKLASLGKLSAVMAHEINNPLAGSLNYTVLAKRIIEKNEISDERRESLLRYLDFIKCEITRVGDIVKNMLVFAKQTGSDFSAAQLGNLLESALMLVNHKLELGNIKLFKEIDLTDDRLICDAGQIRQALVALLMNAIEAIQQDGTLTVQVSGDTNVIKMVIQDDGVGIPAENLANIFDPFFSTKKQVKGVGLGLAVVHGIIDRHKGTIQVESEPDKGTVFYIELPRNPSVESEMTNNPQLKV